ncbi:uncharacterized protein BP5553_06565 [Venustampulla echinocandica]|uniref:phosphoadenylyl-sulfate reductase (thioredoxin) n=1 Tax=Venustampulla echinocandica TaxID=2656787 RepID=A0A370TKA6_9HELO|nr:uncharacterized protein BP5553_06565 [Venustampulla echinocandica]RDL35953.1 hypothetical protein BP5553_06565 [Venustampulla echinocandica]
MGLHVHSDSGVSNLESGYASGASSCESLPRIVLTKHHLKFLNNTLNELSPFEILRWCKLTFPNLYQTTAFGVTGLVTLDMLSKLQAETPSAPTIDAIFLDTLYHFQETLSLVEKAKARYPNVNLHVYSPEGVNTTAEFEARHGKELWSTNADLYDWVAKVEPAQRAYSELQVAAVLTGRRRSQGAKRESLDIIEIDEAGLIKINPLASWSFKQVQDYISENDVPYNELLDRGYKSVGDWHSTEPVKEGEDERAGRWKGTNKTECGIHNKRSKYAQFLYEMEQKQQQEELAAALTAVEVREETPASSPEQVETTEEVAPALEKVDATPVSVTALEEVQETEPAAPVVDNADPVPEVSALESKVDVPAPTVISEEVETIEQPVAVSVSEKVEVEVEVAQEPLPSSEQPEITESPIVRSESIDTDTPLLASTSSTRDATPGILTPTLEEKRSFMEDIDVNNLKSLNPATSAFQDVGISDELTAALEKFGFRDEQRKEEIAVRG